MTLAAGPTDDPDGAPLAVAVRRSIGGILLVLAGGAVILGADLPLAGISFVRRARTRRLEEPVDLSAIPGPTTPLESS